MSKKKLMLISISAIFMIGLPLVNNILLVGIYNQISGDVMLQTPANILEVAISILATFILYVTLGILINALLRTKFNGFPTKMILVLYILSLIIVYVADFISSSNVYAYLVYILFVLIGDAVILIATILVCNKTVRQYKIVRPQQLSLNGKIISMKNPLSKTIFRVTMVIFVYNFIFNTIETVMLIVENGFPGNVTEVMYLLEPYLSFIIYAVAGYLTMIVVSIIFNKRFTIE